MSTDNIRQEFHHADSPSLFETWEHSGISPQEEFHPHDFLDIVSTQIADFLHIIPFINGEGHDRSLYSKRLYDYISSQAKLTQELLDSCGAKENRAWFLLRELVSTIRF